MSIPVILKVALDASKARALAESVGIIPHPNSNWKWALRQLRAKNPAGAFQNADDLMMKGRELAKGKEKMGLLPNNVRQRVKALSRKQKMGVEVGYNQSGKYEVGRLGSVNYDPKDPKLIHTHPAYERTGIKQDMKGEWNEVASYDAARMLDRTLSASPSGRNPWQLKVPEEEFTRLWNKELSAKAEMDRALKLRRNMYKKHLIDVGHGRKTGYQKAAKKWLQASYRLGRVSPGLTSDMEMMQNSQHLDIPHNIMADTVTGVHKYRYSLPGGTRSVYFKGGLS